MERCTNYFDYDGKIIYLHFNKHIAQIILSLLRFTDIRVSKCS